MGPGPGVERKMRNPGYYSFDQENRALQFLRFLVKRCFL